MPKDDFGVDFDRVMLFALTPLIFNEKECFVLKIKDITTIENLAKIKSESKMMNLYNSTINHEMLIPLRNVIQVSENLEKEFQNKEDHKSQLRLIKTSSQMMLSQIRMQLDRNLMKNDKFLPNYTANSITQTIQDTIEMIQI